MGSRPSHTAQPQGLNRDDVGYPGPFGGALAGGSAGRHVPSFQPRDYKVWKAEIDKFVAEGKRVFHDDKALGSTIGISCDMCHPDAANTHPETYPKYQVQLQRVALLRDMIDWCIENPIKGKALNPNDPKLRALEAYIYAQRKGVALDYGKH
jgi:thiosulfate dehydrogenase